MATLRKKRKLAAVTRETQEEHPENGQSRNTSLPRINAEYITQVSKEIEGRVTKKLFQEFRRTEPRMLGALSKLDEFLLNPQIRTHSGTVPWTFRNTKVKNQGTNEDDFLSDPHPQAGIFGNQIIQNSGPEVGPEFVTGSPEEIRQHPDMMTIVVEETLNGHDMMTRVQKQGLCGHDINMVTRVQKESLCGHDMLTGVQEDFRYRPHMVTGIQEDIPYCSLRTSSGKQKKSSSTSHPHFRSEDTPATIEADQILLALQQLATNSNSANFNNNSNIISKLHKSLTTTLPTFETGNQKNLNCLMIYSKRG